MKIKYKFTMAIMFFLIIMAGITAATDSILAVDSANKTTTINLNATYLLTVNNTGANADTFNLAIENPQNAMVGLSIPSLNLGAGMNGTVLLNVTNASSGIFLVNVTATSQTNPDVNQTVTTTTTVSPLQTTINAVVRIEPQTLNIKSKGKFTAFISLPSGFNVSDIIPGTIMCEGAPAISSKPSGNNASILIVKFNRKDLVNVPTGNAVVLTVTGKVSSNGSPLDFQGNDTIRVINKGKGKDDAKGDNVGSKGSSNSEVKSKEGKGNSGGKSNQGNGKGKK